MSEQAVKEMDIFAWLSVAACGYSLDRRQRAHVMNYGRHVLARHGASAVFGRVSDPDGFARGMMQDGRGYRQSGLPHAALAGMLVKCLKRMDRQLSDEWLGRVSEQAIECFTKE